MSGQALYRRWRSQTFDEIIAQEHVTRTLQNALRAERVAHAYLFTGPRGTGKTSTARILAKAVNCLAEPAQRPCNACARCRAVSEGRDLDLIEIDAASNRGIDEIRELRDKVAFVPNEGRFKVYVVDEVHMLTTEAFNALLKTLEEPPPHAIFVLATTEPQRIPATILSRCQRFDFRRVPLADLCGKLQRICEAEGIRAQPAVLEAIGRRAGGSFRDAESLLDQLAAYGDAEITLERVQELLGGVSAEAVADLVDAWLAADLGAGLRLINSLVDGGTDARQLHQETVEYLRSLMLLLAGGADRPAGASPEAAERMRRQLAGLSIGRLLDGLRTFSQVEAARGDVRPQMPLELAFAQAVVGAGSARPQSQDAPTVAGPSRLQSQSAPAGVRSARSQPQGASAGAGSRGPTSPHSAAPVTSGAQRRAAPAERPPEEPIGAGSPRPEPPAAEGSPDPARAGEPSLAAVTACWPQVLAALHEKNKTLEALLRSGRPVDAGGGRVVLAMEGSFHRDRVMEEKSRRLLEELLQGLLGTACHIECIVGKGRPPARQAQAQAAEHPIVREDPILRYAVQDLGAQVSGIEPVDGGEARTGTE